MSDKEQVESCFSKKILACPLRGHWTSFRLVDEQGNGRLDGEGFARMENHYRGPVVLTMDKPHLRTSFFSGSVGRIIK
ncbi:MULTISPECIES: hypothetical protein [unclassified Pseudomonas]|uniref:Uncharacterized protein n=1 Tax=Pseudomonas sp. MYb327 TaxID=2745230 RepID=A0AAU8E425_9PSED